MRSIGEPAHAGGLTPSALRFHDGAGVLVPAFVDPVTGHRRYADDQLKSAQVLASLRRVGMPLTEVCRVLDTLGAPAAVAGILTAHLRRLEDGLAAARIELSRVSALPDPEESPMSTITVSSRNLTPALDALGVGRRFSILMPVRPANPQFAPAARDRLPGR
jgi:DNA-binding transcriptional MerR regulator